MELADESATARVQGTSGGWRRTATVGFLLFSVAFALRVWCGSYGLHSTRHWDEGYALDNVRSLIETGSFAPARSYYPSPVFNLPAAALVTAGEWWHERAPEPRWATYDNGRFRGMSYLLLRGLMALYGAIAVLLLWRIGCLLAGRGVGLLAAILLIFLPWHIHAGAIFKPDSLLVMSVLLAIWAAVHAIRSQGFWWAALAGLGIALSASAKLTGVLVAAPVAVGLLASDPRSRSRWGQLAVAGAVSAAAFVAMNPYWTSYLHFVESLKVDYAKRARWRRWTKLDGLGLTIRLFFERQVHGPIVGALVPLGAMAAWLGQRHQDRIAKSAWAAVLLFPFLYAGVLATQTAYFKPNNLLPVMPFTCLFAATALCWLWRFFSGKMGSARVRRLAAAAGLTMVFLLGVRPGWLFVYRQVTPSTMDRAQSFLRGSLHGGGRWIYSEVPSDDGEAWFRARPLGAATKVVEALDALPGSEIDRADAEIFSATRLEGRRRDFYEGRLARVAARDAVTIRPKWFELRGEPLVVLRHPRRPTASGELTLQPCVGRADCSTGLVPGRSREKPGGLVTVHLRLDRPQHSPPGDAPRVTVEGEQVEVRTMSQDSRRWLLTTAPLRRRRAAMPVEIRFEDDVTARRLSKVAWTSWRQPR